MPNLHQITLGEKIWKAIHLHHELTSSIFGAGIRTARHRLLMGAMTFDVELQQRINLQVAIYFSIVLLNACWASFVSLSTSVNSTTKNKWAITFSYTLIAYYLNLLLVYLNSVARIKPSYSENYHLSPTCIYGDWEFVFHLSFCKYSEHMVVHHIYLPNENDILPKESALHILLKIQNYSTK